MALMKIEPGAYRFGRAQRIAGQAGGHWRVMRLAARCVRKQLLLPLPIVRETPGCQNDATRRNHPARAVCGSDLDGDDATIADLERLKSAGGEDVCSVFEGRQHESGHERVAIGKVHRSMVDDQIAEVASKLACNKPE